MNGPNIKNPNSSLIQQLELNTPTGLQRLIMILASKIGKANGTGVAVITVADVQSFVAEINSGKRNLGVVGENEEIKLLLVDDDQAERMAAIDALSSTKPVGGVQ